MNSNNQTDVLAAIDSESVRKRAEFKAADSANTVEKQPQDMSSNVKDSAVHSKRSRKPIRKKRFSPSTDSHKNQAVQQTDQLDAKESQSEPLDPEDIDSHNKEAPKTPLTPLASDSPSKTDTSKLTDKDWAKQIALRAIRDPGGNRYYLTDQDEVLSTTSAVERVEDEIFEATGYTPEDRQVRKILKAITLLSKKRGELKYPVFYRVGRTQGDHTAIDLCNSAKQYLVLDVQQEKVKVFRKDQLKEAPAQYRVLFRCDEGALPLLEPEYVDDVVNIAQTFNHAIFDPENPDDTLQDDEYRFAADRHEEEFQTLYSNLSENDFLLLRSWIAYTLITTKGHGNVFPLLFLKANLGEGKTVIFRQLLHWLSDPRTEGVVRFDKNLETMGLLLNKSHSVLIDNMRQLLKDHSDFFCSTATGSMTFKRMLYKDGDLYGSELHAAVAMNGVHDTITEPDLISRTLFIHSQAPEAYLDEGTLQKRFERNRPWFFAVVLRDAMRMLYHLKQHPNTVVNNASRLVRFSRCLSALDCYRTSETLLPYLMVERQQDLQRASQINDPMVEALYDILTELDGEYRGTTAQLLELLNERVSEDQRPGWWPVKAQALFYRMQEREGKLRLLKIISSHEQPELLNPRKGEVVYQISDFSSVEH